MTDTSLDTGPDTEPRQPLPLPRGARLMLRILLDAGGTGFIDGTNRVVSGTPSRPGRIAPGEPNDWLALVAKGLIGGERRLLILKHRGRHVALHGTMANFNDTTTDVDLAAWGRGEMDYLTGELLEAIDARFARVATSRPEALALLLDEGMITVAEARQDVPEPEGSTDGCRPQPEPEPQETETPKAQP
jgi:hypothetical protein